MANLVETRKYGWNWN